MSRDVPVDVPRDVPVDVPRDVPVDVPREGSLADDPRVRAVLEGSGPFARLEHHEVVTSTFDVAREELRAGADVGLVVVADRQTAGRGRRGRTWTDDLLGPGGPTNLAVTASGHAPASNVGLVPLAAGLAVADAYRTAGGRSALKWPNDVLLDGRKGAGVLVERLLIGPDDVVLIGCGLDLDWRGVPREAEAAGWTSLAEATDRDVDRGQVLADLLAGLGRALRRIATDPAGLVADLRTACTTLGAEVAVMLPAGDRLVGTALDLDEDGHLVVDADGSRTTIAAGDVVHLRPT